MTGSKLGNTTYCLDQEHTLLSYDKFDGRMVIKILAIHNDFFIEDVSKNNFKQIKINVTRN